MAIPLSPTSLTFRSKRVYAGLKGKPKPSTKDIQVLSLTVTPTDTMAKTLVVAAASMVRNGTANNKDKGDFDAITLASSAYSKTLASQLTKAQSAKPKFFVMANVAQFIFTEMLKNIDDSIVGKIRLNHREIEKLVKSNPAFSNFEFPSINIPLTAMHLKTKIYQDWISLVKKGAAWDFKASIEQKFGGKFHADPPLKTQYSHENWANIHYGYVGAAAKFSDTELLTGAGIAQVIDNETTADAFIKLIEAAKSFSTEAFVRLDETEDHSAIQLGITLWNSYGRTLNFHHFLNEIRKNSATLKTRY